MKQATWVLPKDKDCDHEPAAAEVTDLGAADHPMESRTGT